MPKNNEILEKLEQRRQAIRHWIEMASPETASEQAHLDEDSSERAYWNHGYQSALSDVIELLNANRAWCIRGTTSH